MKKNLILFGFIAALFTLSCVYFARAYRQFRIHAALAQRSVAVYAAYQHLGDMVGSIGINSSPARGVPGSRQPQVDTVSVFKAVDTLRSVVRDSVNCRIVEQLARHIRSELLPGPDANAGARAHLHALSVDSLVKTGLARTRLVLAYRSARMEGSLAAIEQKIIFFLGTAGLVLLYLVINLLLQYRGRLNNQRAMTRHEKRFQALVENSKDLIAMVDAQLKPIYRSPSTETITGFTDEEMLSRSVIQQVHPEDREQLRQKVEEIKQQEGAVAAVSYRMMHKNGHYLWLEGNFTNYLNHPSIGAIVLNMRDVSAIKAHEGALSERDERFRQTLDNMMEGVQIINFNWDYVYVNQALLNYSGYVASDMVGHNVKELYPGVEESDLYKTLEHCMQKREAQRLETPFIFPNGLQRYFDLMIQPVPEGIFILSMDITDRHEDKEALERTVAELRDYRYALDEAAIVAITDQKGVITHVNDNFCRISKYSREELLQQDHRIVNSGYHPKEFIRDLWRTIASGHIWRGELKNRAKDGKTYWVDTTIVPFMTASNKPYQYLAIRADITARKETEAEVEKLNRLYAFISAINQTIVHINDKAILLNKVCEIATSIGRFQLAWIESVNGSSCTNLLSVSGSTEGIVAVKRSEGRNYDLSPYCDTPVGCALASGHSVFNNRLLTDTRLEDLRAEFRQIGIQSAVCLPIRMSGKIVAVFNLGSSQDDWFDEREMDLLEEAAGDISFALENFEKAAQHQRIESLVLTNERRFRALIEKSRDMKTLTNIHGQFTYVSPSLLRTFGYSEEELLGRQASDFFHPDDRLELSQKRNTILQAPGAHIQFQYRLLHQSGYWIWCEGTLTNLLDDPDIKALVSNFRNITDRKRLEEEREFTSRNLAALINNTHDLLWSIDRSFRLLTYNLPFLESIRQHMGRDVKPGDSIFSIPMSEEQRRRFEGYYRRAFAGEVFTTIDVVSEPQLYIMEISFYPIRQGDQVVGTACHSRDITERRRAEQEREAMVADLVQYNKNLEQFTFIVSHNLRSPIAHILGISNVLKQQLSPEDRERSQAYLINSVNQLDTVVNDLNKILDSRNTLGLQREAIDLAAVLEEVKHSIGDTLNEEQVRLDVHLAVSRIFAFRSYIYSIFLNLITNAIKYRHPERAPVIRISSALKGKNVVLQIADNGLGMDLDQYGDKVFGMYQRFHLEVSGKGLGLFMVRTHVEAMNGEIKVTSFPDKGTEFLIRLPAFE